MWVRRDSEDNETRYLIHKYCKDKKLELNIRTDDTKVYADIVTNPNSINDFTNWNVLDN